MRRVILGVVMSSLAVNGLGAASGPPPVAGSPGRGARLALVESRTSWTPEVRQCVERRGRYAWTVRAGEKVEI